MITLRPHQKRIVDIMKNHSKGQVIVPTGGGKTMCMIHDLRRRLKTTEGGTLHWYPKTFIVVAPRILLANQLCSEFLEQNLDGNYNVGIDVMHVHSGETHYYSTTKSDKIKNFVDNSTKHLIIFTTYHSLKRVVDSDISIDGAYFDEAHNSVTRSFSPPTESISRHSKSTYFFTATPRISYRNTRGMNNGTIYGNIICNIEAKELIDNGSIIPPTIVPFHTKENRDRKQAFDLDSQTVTDILDTLDSDDAHKVLVSVPSSRMLGAMMSQTDLIYQLEKRGFEFLHITSKFGAYVNRQKVNREKFFDTLTQYGRDKNKKFIIFHYSILSEGINVSGLTHCILLRQLDVVSMAQTIGRVIRMDTDDSKDIREGVIKAGALEFYRKKTGYVTVPCHANYGQHIIKRLQTVVDSIFINGLPPESLVV